MSSPLTSLLGFMELTMLGNRRVKNFHNFSRKLKQIKGVTYAKYFTLGDILSPLPTFSFISCQTFAFSLYSYWLTMVSLSSPSTSFMICCMLAFESLSQRRCLLLHFWWNGFPNIILPFPPRVMARPPEFTDSPSPRMGHLETLLTALWKPT